MADYQSQAYTSYADPNDPTKPKPAPGAPESIAYTSYAAPAAPASTLKAGWTDLGNGMVQNKDVYGGAVDINSPWYTNSPGGATPPAGGAPPAAGGPITDIKQVQNTPGTVGQTTAQGAPTTVAQSFQQALINRLNPGAISADSASIKPAIDANRISEQRGMERNRGLLAERAAAQGQDMSGGFETNLLGLAQDRAGREGQFVGNAVQHANDLQNQDMTSAASMIGNLLSGNANRDVQQSLGQGSLDNQRYGIDTQAALGHEGNSNQLTLGQGGLNLGLLQALLGNSQFGQSLAQNGAQFGQSLDQSGLLALLGGL